MYRLQVKFTLCLEIDFLFLVFRTVVFAQLVCSFIPPGVLGLIAGSTHMHPLMKRLLGKHQDFGKFAH